MAPGTVTVAREGPRASVTWDRPPLNVFDIPLLTELAAALRREPVRSAHVVVVGGARHRWSAGFSVEDHMADRVHPMFAAFRDVLTAFSELPPPIVARVEGPCLGGGLEMLLACDLAIAGASATFGQPEIRLGVFPPFAAAVMESAVGPQRAAELLLLGETLGAERAAAIGLVSRVVPEEALEAEVDRTATRLCGLRREALVLLKSAMRREGSSVASRLSRAEKIYLEELMRLPSAEEGLRAFLEKREPVWPAGGP